MIDVKKLITGFLILATAATCSGVILLFVTNLPASPAQTVPQAVVTAGTQALGASAFLPNEPTQDNSVAALSTSTLLATSSDPNNLTQVLATAFVNGIAVANPNGPISDNGNSVIAHPDTQAIANQVASVPALANYTPPNWDIEADSQPIKIIPATSQQDVSTYSQSLSQVVNKGLIETNVQAIVSSADPDPTQVSYVRTQIQQTLSNTLALPTPKTLVPFQKSFVKMMVYQKNELLALENSGDDPVKTSLIIQDQKTKYAAAEQNFQNQIQKAASLDGFAFGTGTGTSENRALAFFNKALGIQTAHAQWLTFDAANFSQWIQKFV